MEEGERITERLDGLVLSNRSVSRRQSLKHIGTSFFTLGDIEVLLRRLDLPDSLFETPAVKSVINAFIHCHISLEEADELIILSWLGE